MLRGGPRCLIGASVGTALVSNRLKFLDYRLLRIASDRNKKAIKNVANCITSNIDLWIVIRHRL